MITKSIFRILEGEKFFGEVKPETICRRVRVYSHFKLDGNTTHFFSLVFTIKIFFENKTKL